MSEASHLRLRVGSRWKHLTRGSLAIVLEVEDGEVSFQFPSGANNPARGMGRWPIELFFKHFVCEESPTKGV